MTYPKALMLIWLHHRQLIHHNTIIVITNQVKNLSHLRAATFNNSNLL